MNNKIKYFLIGGIVLCLAYPAAAWLIGLRVQATTAKREQEVVERFPGTLAIVSRYYHRGIFGATEEVTYGFGPAAQRSLAPFAGTTDVTGLQMTVRNSIHHGPLPQFRSIAMATVDSEVELPPALTTKLHALLGGDPAIQIRSSLGWLGGATVEVKSPGYQGQLANGTQIQWQGFDTTGSGNSDLSSSTVDARVSEFGLKSGKFQFDLNGLHATADWKRAFQVLYTGPYDLKIATVTWQSVPASGQSLIQGISWTGNSSTDGDYYHYQGQFGADAIQTPKLKVTRAIYAVSFEHVYGPALAAMTRDTRAASAGTGSAPAPSPQQTAAAAMESMKKNGTELLLRDPVVNITRLGFAMPQGEVQLSAKASAPGLKRQDIDGPQFPGVVMQHLNVVADLRIDTALVDRLLADSGRKDVLARQIDAVAKQGYIKRDGAAWIAHLTFVGGKIQVNGVNYPPAPQ